MAKKGSLRKMSKIGLPLNDFFMLPKQLIIILFGLLIHGVSKIKFRQLIIAIGQLLIISNRLIMFDLVTQFV